MPCTPVRPLAMSRRPAAKVQRLAAALTAAVLVALGAAGAAHAAPVPTTQSFLSRPSLHPTAITFTKKETKSGMGYIFTAPKSMAGTPLASTGVMIVDGAGNLVWFKHVGGVGAYNFRKQTYEGKPVLTWWHGIHYRGFGSGDVEIYNTSYHHVATVSAGNGYKADFHEFFITPQNTALLTAYRDIDHYDLSKKVPGGTKNDKITDNVLQEVDIKTGKVLLEWHTKDTIAPSESYAPNSNKYGVPYDWVHLNSAGLDSDGNIIASARGTHAFYRINRKTGKLMERIGGKKSDYKMGPGAQTAFQHDVQRINDKQITAFDNNADVPTLPIADHQARGVILNIDEKKKTVKLARQIQHPGFPIQSVSMGNMQTLANGNVFFGWGGQVSYFSEVDKTGKAVIEGQYATPRVDSYRAYRQTWTANPTDRPAAVATRTGGKVQVAVSWNGATHVHSWRVLAGTSTTKLATVTTVPRKGFETKITITTSHPLLRVLALDAGGKLIGTTRPVKVAAR
mgnify:CR=1 FL=1